MLQLACLIVPLIYSKSESKYEFLLFFNYKTVIKLLPHWNMVFWQAESLLLVHGHLYLAAESTVLFFLRQSWFVFVASGALLPHSEIPPMKINTLIMSPT